MKNPTIFMFKYDNLGHKGNLQSTIYVYHYRGYEYSVVRYYNGCDELPLQKQHEIYQDKIDKRIEIDSIPASDRGIPADEALKDFFKLLEEK